MGSSDRIAGGSSKGSNFGTNTGVNVSLSMASTAMTPELLLERASGRLGMLSCFKHWNFQREFQRCITGSIHGGSLTQRSKQKCYMVNSKANLFIVSMAIGADEASSSSSLKSTQQWKFHVFLSFRGQDTRKSFTDYLYTTLQTRGIVTFRDDEQLEKGEVISQQLLQSIEESLFVIVVVSPNYASSSWCLDELEKILECKRVLGREVFPVFYDTDPYDITYQKGSFGEALRKHEQRYKGDKIKRWRDALKEIAGLSGWNTKNRYHSELIEEIVAELWRKLQTKLPSFNDGLVGINSRLEDMFSLLGIGSEDVRFVGIWGMGGIGKTTLARAVFERIRNEFEISCFLANVREISGVRGHGLVDLQRELLSHLKIRGMEVNDSYQGKKTIRNLLCNKKVLLVLDDVSAYIQLENLASNKEWFGQGSRVIITTRDRHLLTSQGVSETYEIQILNSDESLQLFCQKAFRDKPEECYLELSKNVVQCAGGLPLALKVLGSFFCGRSVPEWKNALEKIRKVSHKDIISTLQISYEALDDIEKNIFLNIACFFKGMDKSYVTHILKICDLYPTIGINVLQEKSLITEYYQYGKWYIGMHDILQDMGKNLVIHESINDAGKRSRLWLQEDIDNVLSKNKGTEFIQGIVQESHKPYKAWWDPNAFSKMCNLKILKLERLDLSLGLTCLSEGLRYLEWKEFPLEELPRGVQLDELVDLRMHNSKIKQLWQGTKYFRKLKVIDLRDSEDLIRFPCVSGVPYLEQLVLEGCIHLIEVHQSVGLLKKLKELNLRDCVNLKILPRKLETDSLEDFVLSGCSKVRKLPEFGDNIDFLTRLDLNDCKSLVCLPRSIHKLKSLRILNTSGCLKFSSLPENLGENEALETLDVSGTALRELPQSIVQLKKLKILSLGGHTQMGSNSWNLLLHFTWMSWRYTVSKYISLPPLSTFSRLEELDLSYINLRDESLPDDLGSLSKLMRLNLSGNNFTNLPTRSIANLSWLYELKLDSCPMLESIPVLPTRLRSLYGRNCSSWKPYSNPLDIFYWFASNQLRDHWYEPFLIIPGGEIPPWFINQNYFQQEICSCFHWEELHENDYWELLRDCGSSIGPGSSRMSVSRSIKSLISIIVEIPDYCLTSKWWGVAVCLTLEIEFRGSFEWLGAEISWICKTPGAEFPIPSGKGCGPTIDEFSDPHLCILLLRGNDKNIQRHLQGDNNKIQLLFNSTPMPCGKLKINKCGCRVICEKDLKVWDKVMRGREQSDGIEMDSSSSSSLSNAGIIEIVDERGNTSSAEAKRRKIG